MTSITDQLQLELMGMEDGETKPLPCPFCNATHEDKLYLTRSSEGSGLYQCKRASCGAAGALGEHTGDIRKIPPSFTPKLFTRSLTPLRTEHKDYLNKYYQITNTRGIRYDKAHDLLAFDLQTAKGTSWGIQTKREWNRSEKYAKSCLYAERNVPKLHFEHPMGRGTCAVVEDWLSARKLAPIIPTVALLGTHLTEESALEIRKYYDNLLLALDYDAVDKARKLRETWKGVFHSIDVVLLKADVKDTAYHTLQQVFSNEEVNNNR